MIIYDEMTEYKEEGKVEEKAKNKFGVDKYGRPFEFDGSSIPKLANREMRRKMAKRKKQEGK